MRLPNQSTGVRGSAFAVAVRTNKGDETGVNCSGYRFVAPIRCTGPNAAAIPRGGCCARVHGVCITWCNERDGCTGDADCDTFLSPG
jgi:hypothetical protein